MSTIRKLVVSQNHRIWLISKYIPIEFKIEGAVKRPGTSNFAPFIIPSNISFDALRIAIAERLNCYPGTLQLQYKLLYDGKKSSENSTSIESKEELEIFVDRMRPLIVPQRTNSGKISTRVLKHVQVCFEDANASPSAGDAQSSGSGKSSALGKRVSAYISAVVPQTKKQISRPLSLPLNRLAKYFQNSKSLVTIS